ncbi:PHP domain-containing protein, partial [Streptomyces fuscigenes]|uniref:PHP domain-containing protein n=1 Tax=Streptomyces fuscigenes TaxID=1528880 RepID=UPI001F411C6A
MPTFTHLHTASGFSPRYGASHPAALAERAAERGLDALALTDRDSLAGAVRFAKACAAQGVRPLFGADLAVRPAAPQDGTRGPAGAAPRPAPSTPSTPSTRASAPSTRRTAPSIRPAVPARGGAFVDESAPRAVFLARDGAAGWADLCRLVSTAHASDTGAPLLDWDDNHGDGLVVLLGPDSEVGRALAAGRPDLAARLLVPWREAYGDGLRLEVVHHGRTGTGPGSLRHAARTLG